MSSNNACNLSDTFWKTNDDAYYFVFYVLTPIYFILGVSGQLMLLIGFVRRAKNEPIYSYQVLTTAVEATEICGFTAFVITYKWWSGIEISGVEWYEHNYVLMQFAAHAAVPMSSVMITSSLFVSVSMAADRVFALWRPFVYKDIRRKLHICTATVVCFFIGFSTSIFDSFRYSLKQLDDGRYVGVVDANYVQSSVASGLSNFRNFVRTAGLLALIGLNLLMLHLYRTKTHLLVGSDDRKLQKFRASQNAVTILVLAKSTVKSLSIVGFVAFYILAYAFVSFSACQGVLMSSINNSIYELGALLDFLVVVSVDKSIRRTMFGFAAGNGDETSTSSSIRKFFGGCCGSFSARVDTSSTDGHFRQVGFSNMRSSHRSSQQNRSLIVA